MSETADKPSNGGGGSSRDFAATHPVKKLLETYRNTAGRTLTGPANSSLEEAPYARNRYKLPPDVELSKTIEHDQPSQHEQAQAKEYYMQQQEQRALTHY